MKALMTGNGGEFNSDEMREITSILNVQLCTTAGESPFQNGLCERIHAITDMMLVKFAADYGKVNSQTLLSWANMARNSLQLWNGYSSHQLVFGENPNLPNISCKEWIEETVQGRAGKATGNNKCWYNIQEEISKEKKKRKSWLGTMGANNWWSKH